MIDVSSGFVYINDKLRGVVFINPENVVFDLDDENINLNNLLNYPFMVNRKEMNIESNMGQDVVRIVVKSPTVLIRLCSALINARRDDDEIDVFKSSKNVTTGSIV